MVSVPEKYTLLANLDAPRTGDPEHCAPRESKYLDVDLETLVGDAPMMHGYPHSLVFDFHNYPDSARNGALCVPGDLPPSEFTVGRIAPEPLDLDRPVQIGYHQNRPLGDIRGKYLIELPAAYLPVSDEVLARRHQSLADWAARGYQLRDEDRSYLMGEASAATSSARGYLDDCILEKVSRLVLEILSGEQTPTRT